MMDSSLPNLWIQRTRDAAVKNAESSKLPRADVDIVVGHQRVDSGYMSNHSTRSNSGPFSWSILHNSLADTAYSESGQKVYEVSSKMKELLEGSQPLPYTSPNRGNSFERKSSQGVPNLYKDRDSRGRGMSSIFTWDFAAVKQAFAPSPAELLMLQSGFSPIEPVSVDTSDAPITLRETNSVSAEVFNALIPFAASSPSRSVDMTQALTAYNNGENSQIEELVKEVFEARGDLPSFRPSRILFPGPLLLLPPPALPSGQFTRVRQSRGNPRYLGQMTPGSNQNPDLPDFLNTAVWIEGIPPNCDLRDVLDSITHCDRVFTSHLNRPEGIHRTSAAKVAFFTRGGADRFLSQALSPTGIRIGGERIMARPNRNKYHAHTRPYESRVLRIRGPPEYVNINFLRTYFSKLVVADILDVFDTSNPHDKQGEMEMEWVFGSVLAQASAIKLAIETEPALKKLLQVRYCPDPCE